MIYLRLISFLLLLTSSAICQPGGGQKFALIFAIGNYPPANGWVSIASLRDVGYLRKTLLAQGFSDQHITVVADSQATIKGIASAFVSLTGKVHPGDIVVVHFSSHGEQVEADNDNRIDGFDECVVTYNAKAPNRSTDYEKDQAEYLRGHVLGDYLRQLRAKLGRDGDLLVTMDNCHSGNGTRGLATVRGGAPPLVSAHFDPSHHRHSDSSMLAREVSENDTTTEGLAPYVVFSATRPEELDFETRDEETGVQMGSLTYAICKAFSGLSITTGYPSYRQLFARIQSIMNVKVQSQHPMMEGDGVDRLLFGGQFVHQQPYITLASINKAGRQIILKAGKTAGLDVGALIEICPAGTRDTANVKPLATARIISATDILATAQLDSDIRIDRPVDGWAFITARVYAIAPVSLQIRSGRNSYTPMEAAAIERSLHDLPGVTLVAKAPVLTLVKGHIDDTLKVSGNGYVFSEVRSATVNSADLKQKLQNYAQYVFLQSLSCQVPEVKIDMKLFLCKPDGTADTAGTEQRMKGGRFEAYVGDQLTLWIRNNGTKSFYFNVLDLQPDGGIGAILPSSTMSVKIGPDELNLPAGREYWLPLGDHIEIQPPCGTEDFKVFASPVQIDLENLANTRGGEAASKPLTMMEQLIRSSYKQTRGGIMANTSQPDAATLDYLFVIKPKP